MIQWIYFDTSAAVKLFHDEIHTDELSTWLTRNSDARPVTSDLTRTELRRALDAIGVTPDGRQLAELWIGHTANIRLAPELCDIAGTIGSGTGLRSLDAIHLVAAMQLDTALKAFVTYNKRLVTAAEAQGLPVVSPGAE